MGAANNKCCLWTIIGVVVVVLLIGMAIALGVVYSRHHSTSSNSAKNGSLDDALSQNATFPNGTYLVPFNSLKPGIPAAAPLLLNLSMLEEFGIRVDNSSLVAETGRLSFFFIWLPPPVVSKSVRKARSATPTPTPDHGSENIGIRFGNAATINVVPLSLATVPESGLSVVKKLKDSSVVYQLNVRMPQSMCQGATSGTCTVVNWQPFSLSADATTGEGASFLNALPVACGSQCDSPSTSPCATSCQVCDGQQVAGADTPVTRRYNLGTTSANVRFLYETYQVPDRITVVYEDEIILDSTCIGTNGPQHHSFSYSGSSQEVRVDVEPNCQQTTETQWYFQLSCPLPCDQPNNQGFTLVHTNTLTQVNNGDTVYFTADGTMPALTAYYCGGNGNNIRWMLKISPTGINDAVCTVVSYTGLGSSWDIFSTMGAAVQGGAASLSWTDNQQISGSMQFTILGTNPVFKDAVSAINAATRLWYPQYVAIHESVVRQFDTDKNVGYPLKSSDNGYGMFQLTNPPPTCTQVWSWTANLREGVNRLQKFANAANIWMTSQRQQARQDNNGQNMPVPDHTDSNCVFSENTPMVIEDAVAMKQYNGASEGNYCAWINAANGQAGYWKFNEDNNLGFDYVGRVCDYVPKP